MRKLLFDLDRTLWKCTVEYHPKLKMPYVYEETKEVLAHLQDKGYSMNITSRSSEPEKCHYFLDTLFPKIHFDRRAIYPTRFNKLKHIADVRASNGKFIMFDDEKHILDTVSKMYPEALTILCDEPLNWELIKNI